MDKCQYMESHLICTTKKACKKLVPQKQNQRVWGVRSDRKKCKENLGPQPLARCLRDAGCGGVKGIVNAKYLKGKEQSA